MDVCGWLLVVWIAYRLAADHVCTKYAPPLAPGPAGCQEEAAAGAAALQQELEAARGQLEAAWGRVDEAESQLAHMRVERDGLRVELRDESRLLEEARDAYDSIEAQVRLSGGAGGRQGAR